MIKKRLFITILIIALLTSNIISYATTEPENPTEKTISFFGDVNGDEKITASDARLVLLTSAGLHTGIDLVLADIDNNGKITAIDARYILRASAQLESLNCIRLGHNIVNGACTNCQYVEGTTTIPETTTKVSETTSKETTTAAEITTNVTTTVPPTTVPPTTASATKPPVSSDNLVNDIYNEINKYRASLGLYPLKFNAELSEITAVRAQEASVNWSHTRPDGRDFWTVFVDYKKFDNIASGEILAKVGAGDAKRIVNGWINSPSHNAILVTTKYTQIGIAYYVSNGYWYVAAHTI